MLPPCRLIAVPLKHAEVLVWPGGLRVVFSEETAVTFTSLTPEMIDGYVSTAEPMDKAGSYGIQAMGGSFVTGITGCYYNVMGFPMHRFAAELLGLIKQGTV